MADVQLDADLVIRLKNLDKALSEIKRKIASINLPEFKFSAQSGRDFNNFIRVLGQSGPQLQSAARNINQFADAITRSGAKLNLMAPGLRAFSSAMNSLNASSRSASQGLQTTTSRMEDLGRQTAITVRRFGGFLVARNLIYGLATGFRTIVTEAITFERELSKVAQLQSTTIEASRSLGRFIGDLAVQFGASAVELSKSAQILAQAGKSTAEIRAVLQSLGQASLTPTFGDLQKTTDSLLAVLGQFNIKASESAEVLDILNEVSKDFNVSVDELFEGVRRAGSTFSALSGVKQGVQPGIQSLKEFVALFTAVIDTSRESAETIGTAFRTILPRLLRENTRELLKKELGLDLLDNENQFIGPFKAIEKLFNSLSRFSGTDIGLTKIIEELGGSRQFNRVLPLILEFPKAQRALEIASRSSGSVAKDTNVAYETLAVQLQQLREEFLQLGRELTENGTFRALADGFIAAAKTAAILVKALEPLLPLIASLSTLSLLKSSASFVRGAFFDNAFAMGPVRRAGGGSVGKIDALLTPGELTFSPEAVRINGESALRRFNATGDISALRTLKGASIVPGTGNVDSVHANLEPGSFVVRKSSVQKALGFKKFAMGGPVRLNQGGSPNFRLSSALGGLDVNTTTQLIKFGNELKTLGESTKSINRLFRGILSSSRDVPTALSRISTEINRSRRNADLPELRGGGTQSGNLNVPGLQQARARESAQMQILLAAVNSQSLPEQLLQQIKPISSAQLLPQQPQLLLPPPRASNETIIAPSQGLIDFQEQLRSGVGVSSFTNASSDNPGFRSRPRFSDRVSGFIDRARMSARLGARNIGQALDRGNDFVAAFPSEAASVVRNRSAQAYRGLRSGISRTGRAFSNTVKNFPTQFSQNGAAVTSAAGIGATLAGGFISSKATNSGTAGLGGALSGAGTGALLGATFGPIGAAAGALGGALVGAALSVKSFNEELDKSNFDKLERDFTAGKATSADAALELQKFLNKSSTRTLPISPNGITPGTTTVNRSRADIQKESVALREKFASFAETESVRIQESIVEKSRSGKKLNADSLLKELTPAQLKLLAAGDVRLQSTDSEQSALSIGTDVAKQLIKQQLDAIATQQKLTEAMRRLGQSTTLLGNLFDATDAKLRETEVTLSNFSNKVERIINPGSASTDTRFNVFSNVAGIAGSRVTREIASIEQRAGVSGTVAGDAAVLATQLINELPAQIAAAQNANPSQPIEEFLNNQFKNVPGGIVGNTLANSVNALSGTTVGEVDPQKLTDDISKAFQPSLKIFEQIANLIAQEQQQNLAAVREQAGLRSRIVDRNISQNALQDQQRDAARQFYSGETPSVTVAAGRLYRDVEAITGGPSSTNEILSQMQQLRQGGIQPAEVEQYNRLQKGLETLASDTRVLDATMRKSNELAQAAQGSKSFLERALSGPDEINKINQEARDLQAISQGQQLSGPRTLAALRLSEQLQGAFTPEQIQQQFGISAANFRNNTNAILGRSAGANFAANSRGIADVMAQNLQPSRELYQEQRSALGVQREAQDALNQLDQSAISEIDKALKENAAFFTDAINKALTAPPVQEFSNAINTLANSELKLGGSVNVVVSFNNPQGVLSTIQDDLKTFVGNVVDERVKAALSQQVASANTA